MRDVAARAEGESVADAVAEVGRELDAARSPLAALFQDLASAVAVGDRAAVAAAVAAVDPDQAAEQLAPYPGRVWHALEVARNLIIFAPIALTWYGLSTASDAYARLLEEQPDLGTQPFLFLWQGGFGGTTALTFGRLAMVDAILIAFVIGLSLVLAVRQDLQEALVDHRRLGISSRIRVLLARAATEVRHGAALGSDVAALAELQARSVERERRLEALLAAAGPLVSSVERAAGLQERLLRGGTGPLASRRAVLAVVAGFGTLALIVAIVGGLALARTAGDSFPRQAMSFTEELERQTRALDRTAADASTPETRRQVLIDAANVSAAANDVTAWVQQRSRDRTIGSDDRPIADRLLAAVQATHRAAEGLVAWANASADRPPQSVRDDLRQAEQLLEDLRLLLATVQR